VHSKERAHLAKSTTSLFRNLVFLSSCMRVRDDKGIGGMSTGTASIRDSTDTHQSGRGLDGGIDT
jgi:hypothetical protein